MGVPNKVAGECTVMSNLKTWSGKVVHGTIETVSDKEWWWNITSIDDVVQLVDVPQ